MSGGRIFISYRRGLDNGVTGRLHDRLERHFVPEQLFMDVDSIPFGRDFVEYFDEKVDECDVFLAVIGAGWVEQAPRLHEPNDFVRIEIESALARPEIPIIPVLVDDAVLPPGDELPESLRPLARRNGLVVPHELFSMVVDGRLAPVLIQIFSDIGNGKNAVHRLEEEVEDAGDETAVSADGLTRPSPMNRPVADASGSAGMTPKTEIGPPDVTELPPVLGPKSTRREEQTSWGRQADLPRQFALLDWEFWALIGIGVYLQIDICLYGVGLITPLSYAQLPTVIWGNLGLLFLSALWALRQTRRVAVYLSGTFLLIGPLVWALFGVPIIWT